jgi:hypothetical protein
LQYWGRSNTHQHWFAIGLRFGQKFFNVAFCSYLHLQFFNWAAVPGGRFSNPPTSQSPTVACKRSASLHYVPRQIMKIAKFNSKKFFISTAICCLLTFVTLVAAAARDEGIGGNGIIIIALEKLFYIFRFPTHTLFFEFMKGSKFIVGLFINCIFYGIIIERVLSFQNDKK